MKLTLEVLPYGPHLWERLAPVWEPMLVQTDEPSAFLSSAWLEAWLRAYGAELRPTAYVWRQETGKPAASLILSRGSATRGPFPISRAYLNASGAGPTSEHNDVLVLPEFREAVLDDFVRIVLESGVDELALVGARAELTNELRSRWPSPTYAGYRSEAPYVPLTDLGPEKTTYLSTLSSNTRSKIRRSIRAYEERWGEPSLEIASTASQAREWFEHLIAFHEERWRSKGERGAFADERTRALHYRLIERCVGHEDPDRLGVDIVRVRFGEEVVGILYNLTHRGRVHFFQSGFRYDDDNRLKPGLVAHTFSIEQYIARGSLEYDFLGGDPGGVQYKRSLASDKRFLSWMQLPSPNLKMRVIHGLRWMRGKARLAGRTSP